MGKLSVLLSVCVATLLAAKAEAHVRLDWQGAAGCPDTAAVTALMHTWLESQGTPPDIADVQIDAEVEQSASGYVLALELRTPSGARQMQMVSASCELFAQVIALQASLLIANAQPLSAADPPRDRKLALRAQGLLTSSPVPAPALGLALAAAYVAAPLRVELTGSYLFARERRYPEHPAVGGSLQAFLLQLRPCAVFELGALGLSGCAGAEAGLVRGKGFGIPITHATQRSWFALVAGAGLHVHVSPRWSFWLGIDLLISLKRPVFYVAELGPLYRPELFGLRGAMGIEMRIP